MAAPGHSRRGTGRNQNLPRRHARHLRARNASKSAAAEERTEGARPVDRRLPAIDERARATGIAPAGGLADFARTEDAGEGIERADGRALATFPRARDANGKPQTTALRFERIGFD